VANGTGVPGRSQEIAQVLKTGGFTQLSQLEAKAVAQSVVYYGPQFADVAADVAAMLGIPAAQVIPLPAFTGVQVYLGEDFSKGTTYGATALPDDIVNQTAGDTVCQQANPALIARG
jgi:hypothetical protein